MQGHNVRKAALATAMTVLMAGAFFGTPAQATEGYFQPGYSAIQKSLAGAGLANPEGAMAMAANPASLTSVGDQIEANLSWFSPTRKYTVTGGPGFVAPGTVKSGWDQFIIPGAAYTQQIDANSAWGINLHGHGGMNTNYPGGVSNPACGPFSGVYCGGKAGVNLNQMFIQAGYARRIGNLQLGIAPTFVLQMFDAKGLAAFTAISASPGNMTNRHIDYSYGGGVSVGAIWTVAPNFRLALAGATPMWMSKLDKYKGLFAEQGGFDIPANVSVGAAWDVNPKWTLMLDYKHIFYSDVPSVGNATTFVGIPFGADKGPGFGWSDVDAVSIGAAWRPLPDWTFRAGYTHNTNPVGAKDVTLNILAPGIVTDHISAGFSHSYDSHNSLDMAIMYVPENTVSGIEVTPLGPNPGRTITLSMKQWDISVGYRYKF